MGSIHSRGEPVAAPVLTDGVLLQAIQ